MIRKNKSGFTIVELLIVIVVIAILAAISIIAYNGIQSRARDTSRIEKVKSISKAIEMYYATNGQYPQLQDARGAETPDACGSPTENWGHCDRNKALADLLTPYITIDPTSLSDATQGNYWYYYTSQSADSWQTYGIMVYLEGDGGANDGGYYAEAYEIGSKLSYCKKYSGTGANWRSWNTVCAGGN